MASTWATLAAAEAPTGSQERDTHPTDGKEATGQLHERVDVAERKEREQRYVQRFAGLVAAGGRGIHTGHS
ncbi:hypothetical protein OsJ_33811 [Oryza sativa Japonica Group]|uniref:Uncharacterized protein n=1 Tax=Oryza sativa subsp. japonica TaxID=39947 RepID=B9GAK2_ORYSJ|nr:hypothetical protein OsJ_33811 [Oryza sativa Japonica Group]